MSLSRKIADALDAQIERGEAAPLTVEEGTRRLTLAVLANSAVGVALDHLELSAGGRPSWTIDELRAWGERVAQRVTYLMEPLVMLEVDPVGGEVEIRSKAPSARGDRRSYYEARLSCQGTLRLERVTFETADRKRKHTSFQLSREVLERLVDDLEATIG